ncbi:hypothetical protein ACLQ2N_25370 [Streptomyces sp. DT224]|uniref:hypothetical protein n=1 Tax=Streptomyces sp. DT224 TaxID=3393426 RepID=UPI003CEE5852
MGVGRGVGGLSGPATEPAACLAGRRGRRNPVVDRGGINSAADAVAFLLAGATAVEVGTATIDRRRAMVETVRTLDEACRARRRPRRRHPSPPPPQENVCEGPMPSR